MTGTRDQILVVPRSLFESRDWFTPWKKLGGALSQLERAAAWRLRDEAEAATDWIQPIPCALIRNREGRYCVLRRTRETRSDLRSRISLLVGGHVHRMSGEMNLLDVLIETLRRELNEEVGLTDPGKVRPVGLIVDSTSALASKHAAFVFEVGATKGDMRTRALEEFSRRSKFNLEFLSAEQLRRFHSEFDPWSRLLFEDYIAPKGHHKKPRQFQMGVAS